MEASDQAQSVWINRKVLTDFKCPKQRIEQKVPFYRFPTVLMGTLQNDKMTK